MSTRILIDVLLLVAIFIMPWWITLPCILFLFFYFDFYVEGICATLFIDLLYGGSHGAIFGISFVLTIIALLSFFAVKFVKSQMRAYV